VFEKVRAEFLRGHGMDEGRVRVVWDAFALHAIDVIAARMGPEPGRLVTGTDAIRQSLGGYVEAGAQLLSNCARSTRSGPRVAVESSRGAGSLAGR
jgi:hypothetical protein